MKNKIKKEIINGEAVLDAWFRKIVHETVFQTDTAMYNKFHALKEELKRDLGFAPSLEVIIEQPKEETL